jgi:hypothetical protein
MDLSRGLGDVYKRQGQDKALVFVLAMIFGMIAHQLAQRFIHPPQT